MWDASPLFELCIHGVNDREEVARPLPPQTHLVFPQIGLKFRQIHISVTTGIHFTEHSLNLHFIFNTKTWLKNIKFSYIIFLGFSVLTFCLRRFFDSNLL